MILKAKLTKARTQTRSVRWKQLVMMLKAKATETRTKTGGMRRLGHDGGFSDTKLPTLKRMESMGFKKKEDEKNGTGIWKEKRRRDNFLVTYVNN
jgi:hypothetical protein